MESAEKRIHQVILSGHGLPCEVPMLASSRASPLPQGPHTVQLCGNPVGAGLPAKRPAQSAENFSYFLSLANAASSAWLMVRNTFTRAQRLSLASTSVHGAISLLVRSTMSPTAWT